MNTYRTIASYLPAKARGFIYALLGAANIIIPGLMAMNVITDAKPYAIGLLVVNALGFSMAAGNVQPDVAVIPAADIDRQPPGELGR